MRQSRHSSVSERGHEESGNTHSVEGHKEINGYTVGYKWENAFILVREEYKSRVDYVRAILNALVPSMYSGLPKSLRLPVNLRKRYDRGPVNWDLSVSVIINRREYAARVHGYPCAASPALGAFSKATTTTTVRPHPRFQWSLQRRIPGFRDATKLRSSSLSSHTKGFTWWHATSCHLMPSL